MPTVATVQLFDYLLDSTSTAMAGEKITVTLNAPNPVTSISPLTTLATTSQSTTTGPDGKWQFNLVPNTNISPANSLYTVETPLGSYQVTLGAVGPYQSTAVGTIVNVIVPLAAATSNVTGPLTVAGALTVGGLVIPGVLSAGSEATPGNPSGMTGTAQLMMGLGGTITPKTSGRILIFISGTSSNNSVGGSVVGQIRYGTGAAPVNGAALTGTAASVNTAFQYNIPTNTAVQIGFCLPGFASGLALGTAYWIDLALSCLFVGSTASVTNVTLISVEV